MFEETVEHRLRPIAAAFAESDLVRIRVADETTEIELRRSGTMMRKAAAAVAEGEDPAPPLETIASEVVGIVRLARPPVSEGDPVDPDRELAYIEALGIRNPVRPRSPGRIARIYVSDGQPVDYGRPLFALEPV